MSRMRVVSRMRRAVCFDTTPLIWGVRGESARMQEHMIELTKKYIQFLQDHRHSIMVPTPVISEYLVGASATELHELEIIRRGFEYPALDLPSARLAAELQRGGVVDAIHDEYGAPKQDIRIDAFIIAIAIVNGASWIVTNNVKEFTTLARGGIPIIEVPSTEEQLPLFRDPGE